MGSRGWEGGSFEDKDCRFGIDVAEETATSSCLVWGVLEGYLVDGAGEGALIEDAFKLESWY